MTYLDNAATTFPKPEAVYQAIDKCMRHYAGNQGRSGHRLSMQASREVYETRELLAKLFNIQNPLRIVFTENGTEALNLGLKGVLEPGDHVVTSSMEHNSVYRPLNALAEKGITFSIVLCSPDGCLDIEAFTAALQQNTKMVILNHASNVTGEMLPIREVGEICAKKGILFMVDAAQTAGILDIDVQDLKIDLLAAPGHKGLFGPQGTGFLYIGEGLDLKPLKEGGTGSRSEDVFQPLMMPDRYESGTLNAPGIIGLGAGIKFLQQETLQKIRAHDEKLRHYFIEALSQIETVRLYGAGALISVVSLNIEGLDSTETAYLLDREYDIFVRPGLHCAPLTHRTLGTLDTGTVRFSFSYFNTEDEVQQSVSAIQKICLQKRDAG
jgi:cysteine desulfurase/selenocysteine lyase